MSNAAPLHRRDQTSSPTAEPTYEADLYAWAMRQAEHLRAGNLGALDLQHLAEEIESVGKSEFGALVSNLAVVLQHMLKWDYQPGKRTRSWALSIDEHRVRVRLILRDNPSLKARVGDAVKDAYELAVRRAARETRLRLDGLPATCPYPLADILDRPFPTDPD